MDRTYTLREGGRRLEINAMKDSYTLHSTASRHFPVQFWWFSRYTYLYFASPSRYKFLISTFYLCPWNSPSGNFTAAVCYLLESIYWLIFWIERTQHEQWADFRCIGTLDRLPVLRWEVFQTTALYHMDMYRKCAAAAHKIIEIYRCLCIDIPAFWYLYRRSTDSTRDPSTPFNRGTDGVA